MAGPADYDEKCPSPSPSVLSVLKCDVWEHLNTGLPSVPLIDYTAQKHVRGPPVKRPFV